jgi:hypothetical protein
MGLGVQLGPLFLPWPTELVIFNLIYPPLKRRETKNYAYSYHSQQKEKSNKKYIKSCGYILSKQ